MPRGIASPQGCLEADFYFLGLGLGPLALAFGALAFGALALASVLEVSVLVSVLSQDRDQDTNLQRKIQHNTH